MSKHKFVVINESSRQWRSSSRWRVSTANRQPTLPGVVRQTVVPAAGLRSYGLADRVPGGRLWCPVVLDLDFVEEGDVLDAFSQIIERLLGGDACQLFRETEWAPRPLDELWECLATTDWPWWARR